MTEEIRLTAYARDRTIKPRALRRQGQTPGVLYGQGSPGRMLRFDAAALERVIRQAGMNQLVALDLEEGAQTTLLRDVQRDPVSGKTLHVDFYRVIAGQKLTSTVPIIARGHSPAVEAGGVVNQLLDALEIECLPGDLPADIVVDLALLTEMGSAITVADLPIPPGVTALAPLNTDVLRVVAPRLEEPEVVGAEEAVVPEGETEEAEVASSEGEGED